ncbi:MAG TPA: ABC transporter permease subunit [Anaerolineales bacterium]|nr:ABC transporter permease subunit [Anaerolineales bacterium]
MAHDIFTVIWKEWKELLQFQGSSRSGLTGLLIMIAIFGIIMPLQWGTMWVESAASLTLWLIIPMMLAATIVADTFAGERERHTLETLLASRLSDRAILLGKISAAVIFEWVITQLVFLVALIPTNILHGRGGLILYTPTIAFSGMLLSLLIASLVSIIGVMVSLRAITVKQAQQKLGISVFVIAYVVPMMGVYGLRYVPNEIRQKVMQPLLNGDVALPVLIISAVLIVLVLLLYLVTKSRFQRTRLIFND